MGRKLTVLWDERELGNSVMLFTCFCFCCCLSQCAIRLNAQFGHLVLNRLEKFVCHVGYFSEMQFRFQEESGCIEASFTILETINYMLERGIKMFGCFLDVRKAFDTVWIDGLMYKLFSDLGVNGKLWLAIKDLYIDVKARVLYSGALSG